MFAWSDMFILSANNLHEKEEYQNLRICLNMILLFIMNVWCIFVFSDPFWPVCFLKQFSPRKENRHLKRRTCGVYHMLSNNELFVQFIMKSFFLWCFFLFLCLSDIKTHILKQLLGNSSYLLYFKDILLL